MIHSGYIDNYKDYSNFTSIKDFNNNIEMFLAENKDSFTKGEYIAFKFLTKYCCKVIGVANGKIGTLLSSMYKKFGEMAVSRSTFIRMVKKAAELGILTVHETFRAKGGQGHNLYQFNRYDVPKDRKLTHRNNPEIPTDSKPEEPKSNNETNNLFNTNIHYNNKRITTELDHTYTNDYVPKPFTNLIKCFFDDAKTIEEYWRMAKVCSYDYKHMYNDADIIPVAIDAFKQMIRRLKLGRAKKPIALYTAIFKAKINDMFNNDIFGEEGPNNDLTDEQIEEINSRGTIPLYRWWQS